MDYATIDQLEDRWRALTSEERGRAETALTDAAVQLRRDVPTLAGALAEEAATVPDEDDRDLARTATQVVCAMVRRAMDVADDGGFGVTAVQEARGPFSRSRTYANPMGDLYTTKAERRRLGGGGQTAYSVDTAPPQPAPWWDVLP